MTKYKVPADAKAVILSPSLVTSRAIQLTPAYTGGPAMARRRGHPAGPHRGSGGVGRPPRATAEAHRNAAAHRAGRRQHAGRVINTAADNLRGQGANIRDTIIKLSQAFSALGDHSNDIFCTVKNLSMLVSALQDSTDLMRQLNQNLAAVTGLLADDPNEVGHAVTIVNAAVGDVQSFVADNREALGTTSDKLASVVTTLDDSLDDIKQTLHVAPNVLQNFINIYQPAQGALTGVPGVNNFANPICFLCGAIQAASRLGAEQSAKLCVQYLAPIIKNRQYNFPAARAEPLRRRHGAAQRGHLQRGLAAPGLRSTGARAQRGNARFDGSPSPTGRRPAACRRCASHTIQPTACAA